MLTGLSLGQLLLIAGGLFLVSLVVTTIAVLIYKAVTGGN